MPWAADKGVGSVVGFGFADYTGWEETLQEKSRRAALCRRDLASRRQTMGLGSFVDGPCPADDTCCPDPAVNGTSRTRACPKSQNRIHPAFILRRRRRLSAPPLPPRPAPPPTRPAPPHLPLPRPAPPASPLRLPVPRCRLPCIPVAAPPPPLLGAAVVLHAAILPPPPSSPRGRVVFSAPGLGCTPRRGLPVTSGRSGGRSCGATSRRRLVQDQIPGLHLLQEVLLYREAERVPDGAGHLRVQRPLRRLLPKVMAARRLRYPEAAHLLRHLQASRRPFFSISKALPGAATLLSGISCRFERPRIKMARADPHISPSSRWFEASRCLAMAHGHTHLYYTLKRGHGSSLIICVGILTGYKDKYSIISNYSTVLPMLILVSGNVSTLSHALDNTIPVLLCVDRCRCVN